MTAKFFPESFIWGAATAAHQIEGNNINSDWWAREVRPGSPLPEPSGDAADSYHRFAEDIALLAESGLSSYRFSLEWARIEPAEGMVSRAALDHYRRVIDTCIRHGVTPLITLHHFTSPRWLAEDGGWEDPRVVDRFARYVKTVLPLLGQASHVFTINEPNIFAMLATMEKGDAEVQAGTLPPPNPAVSENAIRAHRRAVELVRTTGVPVGWPVAPQQFFADPGAEDVLRAYAYPRETVFLEASRDDDFVAVQAYTRTRITKDGPVGPPNDVEKTLTGWEYYPQAIAEAVRLAYDITGLPVLVSENGIATADDARRIDYTHDALSALHDEMSAGLPLLGYLHWSLLDNYEWGSYRPTFGLVSWDRETFERTPKRSLYWLGSVARSGVLNHPGDDWLLAYIEVDNSVHNAGGPPEPFAGTSSASILRQLDEAFETHEFPDLGHPYCYAIDARLHAYADDDRWALVVETTGYNPRAANIVCTVHSFGNCLTEGDPGVAHGGFLARVENVADVCDDEEAWTGADFLLRGRRVAVEGKPGEALIDVARRLVPEHRDLLLAEESEFRRRIPDDLPEILTLDEWHHLDAYDDVLPSDSPTFRQLAAILSTGDPDGYRPVERPNTHWSNWPESGSL